MKKELKTDFSMSYADLSAISKQKAATILRDIEEFEYFGVNQTQIATFEEEVRALDQLRTDDDLRGCVTQVVNQRNELESNLNHEIRIFVAHLLRVYKPDDPIFTRMRISGLSKLTATQLFRTGESLHNTLISALPNLEPYGLNMEMVDAFYIMLQSFSEKITEVNNATNERNRFTHKRISLANSIYEKLIIYCRIGKTIWEDSNEALYNDYVINPSYSSPEATNPEESGDSGGKGNVQTLYGAE